MSNCKLIFKIGEKSIELSIDSSSLPNSYKELKSLLGEDDIKNISLSLKSTMLERQSVKDVLLSDLIESDHLIPNMDVKTLLDMFPTETFPEDTEELNISSKKILYINRYKTVEGQLLYGRVINKNGEEIFVVDKDHVKQLINYFKVLKLVLSTKILNQLTDNKELLFIYEKALEQPNLKDPLLKFFNKYSKGITDEKDLNLIKLRSLITLFMLNRSAFRELFYTWNKETFSSYTKLDEICNNILGIEKSRKEYSDKRVELLSSSVTYSEKCKKATVHKETLFSISPEITQVFTEVGMSTENKKTKEKIFSLKKANEKLSKTKQIEKDFFEKVFGKEVVDAYDDSDTGWKIFVLELLKADRSYNYTFKEVLGEKIILKQISGTLESKYGIGFEDLLEYNPPEEYNGKYILTKSSADGTNTYYVSDYYTTEFSLADKFDSLEKAKNFIDSKNELIFKNSYSWAHLFLQNKDGELVTNDSNSLNINSHKYISPKTIITVLDYQTSKADITKADEILKPFLLYNIYSAKMSDFKKFIQEKLPTKGIYGKNDLDEILRRINTPEKAMLFLNEIAKEDLSVVSTILEISRKIASAPKKYYWVKSYSDKITTLIPIQNESDLNEYRKDRNYPIKNILLAAHKVLAPKLGNVDLQIKTDEEIKEILGDKYDFNSKAFIKDNIVYINADRASYDDLFHEYVHILLAFLKTNLDANIVELYNKLLELVWTTVGDKDEDLKRVKDTYHDYSLIDQMEELFAIKFGKWIKGSEGINYSNIFNDNETLKNASLLFDEKKYTLSIKELYGTKMSEVFTKFNADITYYLNHNKTIMNESFKNAFTLSRKRTLWMRQLINEGKLIEKDCL